MKLLNRIFKNKSLVVGLTVFFFFISFEIALRVRHNFRYGEGLGAENIYISHPVLGKVLKPGVKIVGKAASLTINKWGFRGDDFPLEKEDGVYRIVIMGSSIAFGRYATNDDTVWTAQLEKLLNKYQDNYRVEVINAGVPGYKIDTVYTYLNNRVIKFDPDMIILYQGANDINYQSRVLYGPKKENTRTTKDISLLRLREKYLLWFQLLRAKTASLLASEQKSVRIDSIDSSAVENYSTNVKNIIKFCQSKKIKLILSTVARSFRKEQPRFFQVKMASGMMMYNPYLSLAGLHDAFDRFNDIVRSLAEEYGVTLVDSDSLLPAKKKYFRDHVHFTDEGDELVAELLAKTILKKFID